MSPSCASIDQLWRGGALPGLVVTLAKAADSCRQILVLADLLPALQPPEGGQAPWYAASAANQRFATFLLARLGGKLAAGITALTSQPSDPSLGRLGSPHPGFMGDVRDATAALAAAAGQLPAQPALRKQLEAAAPALLPAADALLAAAGGGSDEVGGQQGAAAGAASGAQQEPGSAALRLLASLAQQLDPCALGVDSMPGCCNPACTSLAGASEAGMSLKRCSACKTVRWGLGEWRVHTPGAVRICWRLPCRPPAQMPPCMCPLVSRGAGTAAQAAPRPTGRATRPIASAQPPPPPRLASPREVTQEDEHAEPNVVVGRVACCVGQLGRALGAGRPNCRQW